MHIYNVKSTDALVELMLGGIPVGRIGYPLHCRLVCFCIKYDDFVVTMMVYTNRMLIL